MNNNEERTAGLMKVKLYELHELEPVLNVTYRTLLTYVKTGKLKAVKIGGMWKVSDENLTKFINGEV